MADEPFVPPVFLVNSALRLRRKLLRAADAVVPPYLAVMDRFMGAANTAAMYSAAELGIADHLVDGPLSAEDLAKRTGSDLDAMARMMRFLVAIGVFKREVDGRYANNHVSSALITGSKDNIKGFTKFFGREHVRRAWADLPEKLKTGIGGFRRVHGKSVWDWLAGEQPSLDAFVEGMSSMTEVVAPAIAQAYPFDEVKVVCDVGGGVGIVLAAILRRHPHLRGMLFDSESMLGEARAFLEKKGVAGRVTLHPGSFLETVPRGADAYILKTVVHNWDDDDALQILRNCRAAMQPGQRLLVADFIDEEDTPTTLVPFMDLAGMMMFSGRERTQPHMERLFGQTGFSAGRVSLLPGCQAVFEGVAVG